MLKRLGNRQLAAAVLALAATSGVGVAQAQTPANPESDRPLLHMEASARKEVTDDTAWAKFFVETTGRNHAEVQRQMLERLQALVTEAKVTPGLEVRTEGVYTTPSYGRDGRTTGWRSRGELRIESTDAGLVADTAAQLAQKAQLAGAGFFLSNASRAKVQQELIAQAVQEFKQKAASTAGALGFGAIAIKEVRVNEMAAGGPRPMMFRSQAGVAEMAVMDAPAPVPMEPGKTEVSVSVTGSVRLLD